MLLNIFLFVALAYLCLGGLFFFIQSKLLYRPIRGQQYDPDRLGLEFEQLFLTTPDAQTLSAWYVPVENSPYTVLFCHGTTGNISYNLDTIKVLNEVGLSVMVFDYRGYGISSAHPSEKGTYLDAQAAYNWLVNEKKVQPDSIIIFGRSIGGSIAAWLASKNECASLVVESSFTSYANVAKKFYPYLPVKLFARYKYPTGDYLQKVFAPVMIIHSKHDKNVPYQLGRELFNVANRPKELIDKVGNHDESFLYSGQLYKDAWTSWIAKLSSGRFVVLFGRKMT